MDIEEFIKQVQPRKKRSRLLPFADQIRLLKQQGYTDLQIRDWLAANGIEVSREAVRKFIKKAPETGSQTVLPPSPQDIKPGPPVQETKPETRATSQAEKMRRRLEEQKRDAESKVFKHDKTGKT